MPSTAFCPDPRIAADSAFIADLDLCQARLMDDSRYAWLVLLPRRPGVSEITDLCAADRAVLMAEVAAASVALKAAAPCDRINVGALGNVVAQLHVHVVARRRDDAAWPGPVWGAGAAVPYAAAARAQRVAALGAALTTACGDASV